MSMNHVSLLGRLTKAPDARRTSEGTAVTSFTLAVDRDYQKDTVDFIDCVAWRQTAEFAAKYLDKGRAVAVTGQLQIREWKDKDGKNRRNAEVIVDHIYFADSKPTAAKTLGKPDEDYPEIDVGDELPFE